MSGAVESKIRYQSKRHTRSGQKSDIGTTTDQQRLGSLTRKTGEDFSNLIRFDKHVASLRAFRRADDAATFEAGDFEATGDESAGAESDES